MDTLLQVLTPRRLVTTAVLLLAAVVTVVGFQRTDTKATISCGPVGPIVRLIPCPGSSVPNETEIGVQMSPGWLVDLSVDGTAIPKDQVTTEGTDSYYVPSSSSATGVLKPGNHTAGISYYQDLAEESSATSYTWNFTTR